MVVAKKHLVPAFQPAVMGAIRQSDGSVFKSNKPLPAKKYGSLPKSFNNMNNAAGSMRVKEVLNCR